MEGSADINISAGDNILPREAANQVAIEKKILCRERGSCGHKHIPEVEGGSRTG